MSRRQRVGEMQATKKPGEPGFFFNLGEAP
jgi:hypothetical protein